MYLCIFIRLMTMQLNIYIFIQSYSSITFHYNHSTILHNRTNLKKYCYEYIEDLLLHFEFKHQYFMIS